MWRNVVGNDKNYEETNHSKFPISSQWHLPLASFRPIVVLGIKSRRASDPFLLSILSNEKWNLLARRSSLTPSASFESSKLHKFLFFGNPFALSSSIRRGMFQAIREAVVLKEVRCSFWTPATAWRWSRGQLYPFCTSSHPLRKDKPRATRKYPSKLLLLLFLR